MFYSHIFLLFVVGKKRKKLTKYGDIVKVKRSNKKLNKIPNLKCKLLSNIISPKATSSTPNNLCVEPSKTNWIETYVSPIMQQSSCISGSTPKSRLQIASPKDMFAIEERDQRAKESIYDISALVAGLNNLGLSPKANNYFSNIDHRRRKMKSMPRKHSNTYIPDTQVSSRLSVQVEENNLGAFENGSIRRCTASKLQEENKEDSVDLKNQSPQCTENVDNNAGVEEFKDQVRHTVLSNIIDESQSEVCQIPVSCRVSERISCRISQQKTAALKKDSSYNFDSIFKEPQLTLLPGKKWRKSFIKQKQSGKLYIMLSI